MKGIFLLGDSGGLLGISPKLMLIKHLPIGWPKLPFSRRAKIWDCLSFDGEFSIRNSIWGLLSCFSEKAMAPDSSILAWKIPWTEEPGRLQSMGPLPVDTTERLHFHFSLPCTGEGNGNPLQCSCLENPRDGGAWWAAVYGVAQSWARLKKLGSSSNHVFSDTGENDSCLPG